MATVTWYTYDANGQQLSVSGTSAVTNNSIKISEMVQYTGADFLTGTSQETVMGSLSMSWDNCHNAVVDYDFNLANLGSGQLNLSQLTVLGNTQCDL